jgi:hypothetical protein
VLFLTISYKGFSQNNNKTTIMFTVLRRHVSTHTSHPQARTILFYKVTVLILGSQTLTCLLHRCYLLYYNWRLLQMSLLQYIPIILDVFSVRMDRGFGLVCYERRLDCFRPLYVSCLQACGVWRAYVWTGSRFLFISLGLQLDKFLSC